MSRTPLRPLARAVMALALIAAPATLAGCGGHGSGAAAETRAGGTPYPLRGIYSRDGSPTGFDDEARLGFNLIDTAPDRSELKALQARGLKGFIWLGGYSNTRCAFNESDAWVRAHVRAIAGSPAIAGYFIDDEPDAALCPTAPAQMKARSALVKSIDPRPPTFIASYQVDQFARFAHTVDIIALDHYPCSHSHGCDYSVIDQEAAEADRLGIRYWGVIQAHGDEWYRVPTPAELREEFDHWRATRMEGYLVFAWRWPRDQPSLWLQNNLALQRALAAENAR
jgi:hypothetical protein